MVIYPETAVSARKYMEIKEVISGECRAADKPLSGIAIVLWLFLLTAIAAYIRMEGASGYYYNSDELMNVHVAEAASLGDVIHYAHYETHPPLLVIIAHYWLAVFHSSAPSVMRGLPLLFGLLMIPTYYLIGKQIRSPMTGICCAVLITFSFGCIMQSYVVRQYVVLMFFLSWALYWYFRWRERRDTASVLLYGIFAALACLSHFTGIFAIACFMAHEGGEIIRRRVRLTDDAKWILVNFFIIALAFQILHAWQPILELAKPYFRISANSPSLTMLAALTIAYPLLTATQVFPTFMAPVAVIGILVVTAHRLTRHGSRNDGLDSMLLLAWIALGLGMLLVISRVYVFAGTRRSLWILPFFIPATGWMLGGACDHVIAILQPRIRLPWRHIVIAAMILAGCITYSPEERFLNTVEYTITLKQWQAVTAFLAGLGASDLVVTEKDDGVLFANLYPYMGNATFSNFPRSVIIPYRNSQLLFSPFCRRLGGGQLLDMLKDAQQTYALGGVRRLVFFRTGWSGQALSSLMRCPALKDATFFPPLETFRRSGGVIFMMVPLDVFLRDVASPYGAAHNCLKPPST